MNKQEFTSNIMNSRRFMVFIVGSVLVVVAGYLEQEWDVKLLAGGVVTLATALIAGYSLEDIFWAIAIGKNLLVEVTEDFADDGELNHSNIIIEKSDEINIG